MNRHIKSVLTVLLLVLLLIGIYIIPVKQVDSSKPVMNKPAAMDGASANGAQIQFISVGE